jgi:hypothetical protein
MRKLGSWGAIGRDRPEMAAASGPEHATHRLHELILVGEFVRLELRVQRLAAHRQLEASPLRGDQDITADRALVAGQELGRQTDGLGLVVSQRAVFEHDLHRNPPHIKIAVRG